MTLYCQDCGGELMARDFDETDEPWHCDGCGADRLCFACMVTKHNHTGKLIENRRSSGGRRHGDMDVDWPALIELPPDKFPRSLRIAAGFVLFGSSAYGISFVLFWLRGWI
jgi:hypothetical protein